LERIRKILSNLTESECFFSIDEFGPFAVKFLNVIESVFSGMSRAIIHNSDCESVDAAKAAIDTFVSETNIFVYTLNGLVRRLGVKERAPRVREVWVRCTGPPIPSWAEVSHPLEATTTKCSLSFQ
jgi:hypothetical protein